MKGVIFGILPFLFFVLITSRTSLIGGIRSFIILTGSMEPSIQIGTLVFTKPFSFYRQNDIVTFKKDNRTVTHRIIDTQIRDNAFYYQTMGDANNAPDTDLISGSQILGKTFFTLPYLGNFIFFLKTLPGYFLFILFPAVAFIIFEVINIKKEIKAF